MTTKAANQYSVSRTFGGQGKRQDGGGHERGKKLKEFHIGKKKIIIIEGTLEMGIRVT